jgi:hypothetical protein
MIVRTYHHLHPRLLHDWDGLSASSPYSHLYNSSLWFRACLSAFSYSRILIISVYNSGHLLALLPLVQGKKYGVDAWISPGNPYLDRSTLLVSSLDPSPITYLFEHLSKLGNFQLSELPQPLAETIARCYPSAAVISCSSGSLLPVTQPPFPFMKKEHLRRITSKINKAGTSLSFKVNHQHAVSLLPILINLENSSTKKARFQDILSRPELIHLLVELDHLDPHVFLVDIIYWENNPVCYQAGFNWGNIHSGFTMAYLPQYRHLMPGKLATYLLVEYLYKMGIKAIDMSRGENSFKNDLSSNHYKQYQVSFSVNRWVKKYWSAIDNIQLSLVGHSRLFEIARLSKNFIFRKLLAI